MGGASFLKRPRPANGRHAAGKYIALLYFFALKNASPRMARAYIRGPAVKNTTIICRSRTPAQGGTQNRQGGKI